MGIDAITLRTFIESELASVSDARVVAHVRGLLVKPNVVLRAWDYGEPNQQYPCWTVFNDALHSGTGIAYCEYGFGPRRPWGLVWLGDDENDKRMSIGMDSGWFPTFLDAFFDSFAVTELPVWRVFRVEPNGTRIGMTDEGYWEETWKRRDELLSTDPTTLYECGHRVSYEC